MGTYTPTGINSASGFTNPNGYPLPNQVSNQGMAINGPIDIMIPKTDPRMAHMPQPPIYIRPRQENGQAGNQSFKPQGIPNSVLQPNANIAGVNYARSIPMTPITALPEIPPPYLVAPNLFNEGQQTQWLPQGNTQNNYYQNPNQYGPQNINPAANPLNREEKPITAPEQNPADQAETPVTAPAPAPPEEIPSVDSLASIDNATILMLNERLNSSNEEVRSQGAMEFYKILESNPDLSRPNSPYRGIINAFMVKVLRDPSAVVRQPAFLTFEMGYFYSPSPEVINELEKLTRGSGLHYLEPQTAKGILSKIRSGQFEPPARYTAAQNPAMQTNTNQTTGLGPNSVNERTKRRVDSMADGMFNATSTSNDFANNTSSASDSSSESVGGNLDVTSMA